MKYHFNSPKFLVLNFITDEKIIKLMNKKVVKAFVRIFFQKSNTLPDRKALDDIVFDALGLAEEERKEVYWAVAELVKARLEKARSV